MIKYKVHYAGKPSLGDPYGLLKLVFSGQYFEAESDGSEAIGYYTEPQTPAPNLPSTLIVSEWDSSASVWNRIS